MLIKYNLIAFYISRIISSVGDWVYMIALSLALSHGNELKLTLLWIIRTFTPILLRIILGSISDRIGPKKSAVISNFMRSILVALLPAVLDSWFLFIFVFLISGISPLFNASLNPMITSITDPKNRLQVNSILSVIQSSALILGPLLGGVLYQIDESLAFEAQAIALILSTILIIFIKFPLIKSDISKSRKKISLILEDIKYSFSYIFNNSLLKGITFCSSLFLLGGTAIDAYEVLFVTKALNLGETGYATIVTISGVGFIIGGLINSIISKYFRPYPYYCCGLIIAIVANILFSLSTNLYTASASLLILGLGVTMFNTSSATIMQNTVPVDYQGRVIGFQFLFPDTASTLSVLIAGVFLPFYPIRYIMIGAALVTVLAIIPLISLIRAPKPSAENQTADL